MVCATCPAIEELAAKDAVIAGLEEDNDALRAKVAALAEIAFGGSERRGGRGGDDEEDFEDLGDDTSGGEAGDGEAGVGVRVRRVLGAVEVSSLVRAGMAGA